MNFRPPHFASRAQQFANAVSTQSQKQRDDLPGQQTEHTETTTYFTKPGTESRLLLSAEEWTKVRLTLENAGPVAVGTMQEIGPVLSGKGVLLPTGREREFELAKGDRLFIVASAVNRVTVTRHPIPYLRRLVLLGESTLKSILRK